MEKNQQGFTLLEVLISIAILSMITLTIVSITSNSQTTKERVINEDRENLSLETAMARFEWDISQLFSPLYFLRELNPEQFKTGEERNDNMVTSRYDFIMQTQARNHRFNKIASDFTHIPRNENPSKGELILFTSSNRRKIVNSKQSHFAWVRYILADDPYIKEEERDKYKGQALLRYQSAESPFSSEEVHWEDIKPDVLLRNVKKIEFSFWHPKQKKFYDELRTYPELEGKIRAIKVFIEWYNADGNIEEITRIFTPLYPDFEPEDLVKFTQKLKNPSEGKSEGALEDDE